MSKSEIQSKLKSSIEEKLCSLGAYVDKELPEYILVMIANKKNKEMMEKDLQLFLGQDTTIFIDWLHDLLGKCQDNLEKESLNIKMMETSDHNARSSQERKKKKDKVKSKKVRKSDEKDVKRSSVAKVQKSRSRSVSPRKVKGSQSDKLKNAPDVTPDKSKINLESKKINNKAEETNGTIGKAVHIMSSIVKLPDRPTYNVEISKSPAASLQRDLKDSEMKSTDKPSQSISSTVKITKRPISVPDILKPAISMIQRDIKESVSNNSSKRDLPQIVIDKESDRRYSVFSRLGNNDLRSSKLSQKSTPISEEKRILKRAMDIDEPEEIEDDGSNAWYRHSKIIKTAEEKPVTTSFIVTLKGAEKLNIPLQSRLGPKKNAKELFEMEEDILEVADIESTIDEVVEEVTNATEDVTENTAPVVVTSQASKCKFWPTCKNKDNCPFVHPTELCTNFPNCKFGSACLYLHPNCRFEPNCTKSDCVFTHHQPRILGALKTLSAAGLQQRCLYYPNCTNVNCKFFHPNLPCKFGMMCKAKETCMFYHPSIPHRTELKWVAGEDSVPVAGAHGLGQTQTIKM